MPSTRSLRASALLALTVGTLPVFGSAYVGSAYEGFDYTAGNIAQPAIVAPTGLTGGTGWTDTISGTAAPTIWGVTTGANYTTITTAGNGRFAVAGNTNTAATTNQQIIGTSLTYSGLSGLTPSTGGAVQLNAAASASVGRHFGQLVDSGTFYFSYLVQKTSDTARTTNLAFYGIAPTNPLTVAPVERLSIGQVAPNTNYLSATGVLNASTPVPPANSGDFQVLNSNALVASSSIYKNPGIFERNATTNPNSITAQPFTLGETFMVVGKIEFNVGLNTTDDALTLWLNPTSFTESISSAYFTVGGMDLGTLTGLRVFGGALNGAFARADAVYDEIRFGTSFSDVVVAAVPEPSTYAALLGVAGLAAAALRRRRRA